MRTEKAFFKACWQHEDFITLAKSTLVNEFLPAITTWVNTVADKEADAIYQSIMMNNIVWPQFTDDYYNYVDWLKNYIITRVRWFYSELNK